MADDKPQSTTSKASNIAVSKVGEKVAQAATKQVASKVGATVGSAVPVVGTAAGYAVGKILGDLGSKAAVFVNRHKKEVVAILGAPLAPIGAIFGMLFIGITGVAGSIGISLIVAIIAIPTIIAFIIFIINSGAYIVPPSAQFTNPFAAANSPYIDIVKTPEPPGPFQNSALPLTVRYTIEITATLDTLTNIQFEYTCEAIRSGGSVDCPQPTPQIPQAPVEIVPGEPFSFTYSHTYNSSFSDSLVVDTLQVVADVRTLTGEQSSGSASVIIGTPPTGCFVFTGPWTAIGRQMETTSIAQMSQAEAFMARLCSSGPITLEYSPVQRYSANGRPYGGFATSGKITIYNIGLGNLGNALYTLAHESGHILQQRTNLQQEFLDNAASSGEPNLCTYAFGSNNIEDFAETVGLFISQSPLTAKRSFSCLGNQTIQSRYPLHWQFARDFVFQEDFGW